MERKKQKIKKSSNFIKSILIYTGLFAVIAGFVVYIFKKNGKSLIWGSDALGQHIVTLRYFRDLLIEFIKTGHVSTFTWNIGNGFNMFGNLGYYIFGDIFSYLSIFVSTKRIELLYSVLMFARLYCAGISYLYYCKYKNMSIFGSIIGAIMYTFCSFAMIASVRHPYFIDSMIIFPLLMVGIEKIILENKTTFYTVIIAILYIMSFYFAYMLSIIIAIYGIILTIYTYKKEGIKKIIKKLLNVLCYTLIGIMIAAIVLLPTIMEFMNSERSGAVEVQPYSLSYYRNFMNSFLDGSIALYWSFISGSAIILITLPIFVKNRKKNYPVFLLLFLLFIPLLISQVGSIFDGFAYPNNRWIFVISFLFSYITTMVINMEKQIDRGEIISIVIFVLIFITINYIFEININVRVEVQIIVAILILLLILSKDKIVNKFKTKNIYNVIFTIIFCTGILISLYYFYDIGSSNIGYSSEFIDSGTLTERINTSNNTIDDFSKAIKYITEIDDGFYAISKYPYSYINVSLLKQYRSIGAYYSIMPHYYKDISMDLQNNQYTVNHGLKEFDYRTKISTLLGVKYYIKNGDNIIPYGYSKLAGYNGDSEIYTNNYALPFGVLYNSYITSEEYENLSPLEKENILLKTVVIQNEELDTDETNNFQHNDKAISEVQENIISEVEYSLNDKYNIKKDNQVIVKDTSKNTVEIEMGTVKNSEIYLYIGNIEYTSYTKEEKINAELGKEYTAIEKEQTEAKYKWYQEDSSYKITATFNERKTSKEVKNEQTSAYYFENNEMLLNLGYYDEISGTIKLTFAKEGTYDLSDIKILAVSMESYEEDIENLKKSNFVTTEYADGYLKGMVNAETNGVLQFSTMYNKGWTVYVDGEKVETFEANKYFLGIKIESGEHIIYMEYETPYLKLGTTISALGVLLFIIAIIYKKYRLRKNIKLNECNSDIFSKIH